MYTCSHATDHFIPSFFFNLQCPQFFPFQGYSHYLYGDWIYPTESYLDLRLYWSDPSSRPVNSPTQDCARSHLAPKKMIPSSFVNGHDDESRASTHAIATSHFPERLSRDNAPRELHNVLPEIPSISQTPGRYSVLPFNEDVDKMNASEGMFFEDSFRTVL